MVPRPSNSKFETALACRARGTERAGQHQGRTSSSEAHRGPASPACELMLRKRATLFRAAGREAPPSAVQRNRTSAGPWQVFVTSFPNGCEAREQVKDFKRLRGPFQRPENQEHGASRGRTATWGPSRRPGQGPAQPTQGSAGFPSRSCSRTDDDGITKTGGPWAAHSSRTSYKWGTKVPAS